MSLMNQLYEMVPFLGKALGNLYEVCLFDLRNENPTLSVISTPSLTGRTVGSPPSDVVANYINDGQWRDQPYILHTVSSENGRGQFVSSSYFIAEDDTVVGVLSIVFNQQAVMDVTNGFLSMFNLQASPTAEQITPETLWRDPSDVAHHAICNILHTTSIPGNLTQAEKQDIVAKLRKNGVFRLKGAVSAVASHLSCSEPTIYRYLANIPE